MTSGPIEFGRPTPWIFELAAALENEPVAEMYRDAGTVSRSLSGVVDLFDLPAVCVPIDPTLEAQAAGCGVDDDQVGGADCAVDGIVETVADAFDVDIAGITERGRVPAMLDATERLAETCDAAILGGVTGPASLTEHLLAEPSEASADVREETAFTAGELAVELAGAYLDAGADGVAVLEPAGVTGQNYVEAAQPILNVSSHYEAGSVLVTERAQVSDIRTAGELGFDCLTGAVAEPCEAIDAAEAAGVDLGVGVPRESFRAGPGDVRSFCQGLPEGVLLSSEWTVPKEAAPEAVRELASASTAHSE